MFYGEWERTNSLRVPGYSILMMVPGDLPVFLKIALEVCASQDCKNLIQVIVIPDSISPSFKTYFNKVKQIWKNSSIRLIELNPAEYFLTKKFNNPHMNNWLQFLKGCHEARTTHVLWHDADLFITQKNFLSTHYRKCREGNFHCYGLSEVWDKWYKENGFAYMTSTWELMMEISWVKSFKPWQHRGHNGVINEKKHTFDITLLPQCLTSADRVGYWKDFGGFVHFNYIIGNYRNFQNSVGPFEDVGLKLLLVRLLVDLFDDSQWHYEVPEFTELLLGFTNKEKRVTYLENARKDEYPEFRRKLQALGQSHLLDQVQKDLLKRRLSELDAKLF